MLIHSVFQKNKHFGDIRFEKKIEGQCDISENKHLDFTQIKNK